MGKPVFSGERIKLGATFKDKEKKKVGGLLEPNTTVNKLVLPDLSKSEYKPRHLIFDRL